MSGAAGPFTELLWSGPSVSYAAQAAAASTAQFLMPGASGAYEQPYIPVNWWQVGRRNQRARIELGGVLNSTGGTATTAIFTVGLATASNTATPGTGGGALVATSAITVTSFAANSGWWVTADLTSRMVGYGTSSVSTSILTDARCGCLGVSGTGPPTLLSTVDAGAQWWVYATVTFSTAVITNSCQLTRADVWGLN
jgi:hypothetical protein